MIIHTFHPRSPLHFVALTTPHSTFFTLLHSRTFRRYSEIHHFSSLVITSLTLFLKIRDLQGKVASASAGSWFCSLIVVFTNVMHVIFAFVLIEILKLIWYVYLLQFSVHPVAVVGRLYKNRKETAALHRGIDNTQKNSKTQNLHNGKQRIQHKTNMKGILNNISPMIRK